MKQNPDTRNFIRGCVKGTEVVLKTADGLEGPRGKEGCEAERISSVGHWRRKGRKRY